MLLDYTYDKEKKQMSISYITETGKKELIMFNNINKFRTYYYSPTGNYTCWNGAKAGVRYTDSPRGFDLKYFMRSLPVEQQNKMNGRTSPMLYTWDIENEFKEGEKPDPQSAKNAITTISIVAPNLDAVVLGTKPLTDEKKQHITDKLHKYLHEIKFVDELNLPDPKFHYVYFEKEGDMIRWFLRNVVAKVPILAGWNSIGYDWCYVVNRVKNYFPNISITEGSCVGQVVHKNYFNPKTNEYIRLPHPVHTLILDLMDVISSLDYSVLPVKESLGLDYIASESLGAHKIDYDGNLMQLWQKDPAQYIFYNCIDSELTQLINLYFKTMNAVYMQAYYCKERIGSCFSKIALSEALFFEDFCQQGLVIVNKNRDEETPERGELVGAYVKIPVPGKHKWVICNDFASLYPSCIISCNLSVENFVGEAAKFSDEEIERFKADPCYFVSVNGNVYKNDKEYAFKRIQRTLKEIRGINKYLGKKMEAHVMADIKYIQEKGGGAYVDKLHEYDDDEIKKLEEIGITNIHRASDVYKLYNADRAGFEELKAKLEEEITYCDLMQMAMKYLMNSMYGGSSHVNFFWYNLFLAGDITGEGRSLTKHMEQHLPAFMRDWPTMYDLHASLGIKVDQDRAKKILENAYVQLDDPDAYHDKSYILVVAGDTDSLYISYERLVQTIVGYEDMAPEQIRDILVKLNTGFLDRHNKEYIRDVLYAPRHARSIHDFEMETLAYSEVRLAVKKRYAQLLMWKDGGVFDVNHLKFKSKGLEVIKSSYPKIARQDQKDLITLLLKNNGDDLIQKLNAEMGKKYQEYLNADIDEICQSVSINNYTKYILDDKDELRVGEHCPAQVRGAGYHNYLVNKHHFNDDYIMSGKQKMYTTKPLTRNDIPQYFVYTRNSYPKWADELAPMDRNAAFQKNVLDPFNRILEDIHMPKLNLDGSIQIDLFSLF